VDGEIRTGVGRALRYFAYFELLFGVPATGYLVLLELVPLEWVGYGLTLGIVQALLGTMIGRSGAMARRRQRRAAVNVAIERAIHLGR
jgi:hypothetical protein